MVHPSLISFTAFLRLQSLFAATMDAMGIQKDAQLVVYGRRGCLFTPRIWYMFKTYGQSNVGLMQGSLEDWIDIGGPIDSTPMEEDNIWAKYLVQKAVDTDFTVPDTARNRLLDMDQVLQQVNSCRVIVDTRGSSFDKKGHIPGAKHIPYSSLVEPGNSLQLKDKKELMKILESNEIPKDEPILLSCGSGVSVCHMALVLEECGYPSPFIYDGSWNEWGSDSSTPKVGPQRDT
jgi:thiosulfate/3-mercaptopyruvate sulfurtransferase